MTFQLFYFFLSLVVLILAHNNNYQTLRIQEYAPDKFGHKNGEHIRVGDFMNRKVRVFCWVLTYPPNHELRAQHVKATWGKRCNKLLFMSTSKDDSLPTIKLPVLEGKDLLWGKTKAAFKYVYLNHRHEADWFLKADDDTYVVLENLRYMLSQHDPNKPVYFGTSFKRFSAKGHLRGSAGYVLSRAALDELVTKGLPEIHTCRTDDYGYEDIEMSKCLDNLGVQLLDSRDSWSRGRFIPVPLRDFYFLIREKDFYFWDGNYSNTEEGLDWCSDELISFGTDDPREMYAAEYLLYRLKSYSDADDDVDYPHRNGIDYEITTYKTELSKIYL